MSEPEATAPDPDDAGRGATLINLAFLGTGAFAASAVAGLLVPDSLELVTAFCSLALFAIGSAVFLWAYAQGVVRSRDEVVDLAGLFFLSGSAPRRVAWQLRGLLLAQVVIAGFAAALHPFTNAAFAVLAPVFGLGMMALWGARHGTFPKRDEPVPDAPLGP